jgi:membrane-associated phospholipid phosphatase
MTVLHRPPAGPARRFSRHQHHHGVPGSWSGGLAGALPAAARLGWQIRGKGDQAVNQAGRALLSPGARRPAAITAAACVAGLAVLGVLVAHQSRAGVLDTRIDGWIMRLLGHRDKIIMAMRALGSPRYATIGCVAAVLACALARRYRGALLVAIVVPLASAITEFVLKPIIGRTFVGFLSYPSGHVTGAAALAISLIVVLSGPSRPPLPAAARWPLAALPALAVVAVTLAVVAGQYHYFTDTVGGAAVAVATGLVTALVVDGAAARRARRRAAAQRPAAGGISTAVRELPPV